MAGQVVFLCERLLADFAAEGLFSGVNPFVLREARVPAAGVRAEAAPVLEALPVLPPFVRSQQLLGGEPSVTVAAVDALAFTVRLYRLCRGR